MEWQREGGRGLEESEGVSGRGGREGVSGREGEVGGEQLPQHVCTPSSSLQCGLVHDAEKCTVCIANSRVEPNTVQRYLCSVCPICCGHLLAPYPVLARDTSLAKKDKRG